MTVQALRLSALHGCGSGNFSPRGTHSDAVAPRRRLSSRSPDIGSLTLPTPPPPFQRQQPLAGENGLYGLCGGGGGGGAADQRCMSVPGRDDPHTAGAGPSSLGIDQLQLMSTGNAQQHPGILAMTPAGMGGGGGGLSMQQLPHNLHAEMLWYGQQPLLYHGRSTEMQHLVKGVSNEPSGSVYS